MVLEAVETPPAVTHITRHRRHALTPVSATTHAATVAGAGSAVRSAFQAIEEAASYAVFEALTDIVCITTPDGTLRFLNRAGRDLLGYVDDDTALIGTLFPTHTPNARALLLDEVIPAAMQQGSVTCDTALQTTDGRVFPASQTVIVSRNTGGAPHALTLVIRNVSIERQSAARLGESQRLFEMITRATPDLIYLYDPKDERIVWMNRCPHAFIGGAERDARTMTRREMHQLVHPDDRAQFRATGSLMAAAYGDTDVLAAEIRVRTDGGNWRWLHSRATVFSRRETGAPLLLLGVATDITARKKSEQNLIVARELAEYAAMVKNDFLARICDRFRGAMHEMLGIASDVAADRERRLTARELEQLHHLVANATHLLSTVSDLYDVLRIEAGEMPVHQQRVDARDLVRESVAAFADHPATAGGRIVLALPDDAAPILTDALRLRQALSHLIAHALSATGSGGVVVALHTEGPHSQPVAIDVHDGGDGIAESLQSTVFEPFELTAPITNSAISACTPTGLGLALARAMCEMVGCSLSLSPASSRRGAAFRITLPLASRAAELAAKFLVSSVDVPLVDLPSVDSAGNAV